MTQTSVRIQEVLKGDLKPSIEIIVMEEGGNGKTVAGGVPVMSKDLEYVLYRTPHVEVYYTVDASQGRCVVREEYAFQQSYEDVKLQSYQPQPIDAFEKAIK